MKYFPIHILFKDFSFLMSYFLIMKYNLTGETFLPKTQRNFPGATSANFFDMLLATLFYFWPAIIISFLSYYYIYLLSKKIFATTTIISKLVTAVLLSLSTPILFLYMSNWKWNNYYEYNAGIISWILYFTISVSLYIFLNRNSKNNNHCIN